MAQVWLDLVARIFLSILTSALLVSLHRQPFTREPPSLVDCPHAYYLQRSTACIYRRKRNTTQKRYCVALLCTIHGVVQFRTMNGDDAADSTWSHATVCSKFYVCLRTRLPVCGEKKKFAVSQPPHERKATETNTHKETNKMYSLCKRYHHAFSANEEERPQRRSAYCCLSACCYDGACAVEPGRELRIVPRQRLTACRYSRVISGMPSHCIERE